jgi:pimeloyl-ACP methyl ester carboxylesterase
VVVHDRPGTGTSPADGALAGAASHLAALRPDCAAAHARMGDDLDIARLARSVRGIAELSAGMRESDLPRLPAVVVTADRKPTDGVHRAHARLAAALDAPLVSWPGAGHDLHLDHPDETLAVVRGLVRRVAAGG